MSGADWSSSRPLGRVGIVGVGGIGLASAAWIARAGHRVMLWAPRESIRPPDTAPSVAGSAPLKASGVFEARVDVQLARGPAELAAACDTLLIAVPLNGHRVVMDALLPHLRPGQFVLVSSMASLSALYLFEAARQRGIDLCVASLGTTPLTARRTATLQVRVMTRRTTLGLSALPRASQAFALGVARQMFGDVFFAEDHVLASALVNINPGAHGPLALFNWTRIERAETWPQYHYMTPYVARVIERLDAERLALAAAFGCRVRTIEAHFSQSFGTTADTLADIAEQLHQARGGPPGPTDVSTRFLSEDVPFGLVFLEALGRVAQVPTPATSTIIDASALLTGQNWRAQNDLIPVLAIESCLREQLLARALV